MENHINKGSNEESPIRRTNGPMKFNLGEFVINDDSDNMVEALNMGADEFDDRISPLCERWSEKSFINVGKEMQRCLSQEGLSVGGKLLAIYSLGRVMSMREMGGGMKAGKGKKGDIVLGGLSVGPDGVTASREIPKEVLKELQAFIKKQLEEKGGDDE